MTERGGLLNSGFVSIKGTGRYKYRLRTEQHPNINILVVLAAGWRLILLG